MKVYNMTSKNGNKIANQFIIAQDNIVTFQSYDSTIAIVKYDTESTNQTVTLYPDWNYSVTTKKYLNQFISGFTKIKLPFEKNFSKSIQTLIDNGTIILEQRNI